jgi:hypothetical protein
MRLQVSQARWQKQPNGSDMLAVAPAAIGPWQILKSIPSLRNAEGSTLPDGQG